MVETMTGNIRSWVGGPQTQEKNVFPWAMMQVQAKGVSSNFQLSLPASSCILAIAIHNSTNNSVTGGLNCGTTANGNNVISALAVGANASFRVADTAILKGYFNKNTTLYFSPGTAWNGAVLNVAIFFCVMP
jgi:hypothetical protein